MDPRTIAYVISLLEFGQFITKAAIEVSSGKKTPEQIEADWPGVKDRKDKAWQAWHEAD